MELVDYKTSHHSVRIISSSCSVGEVSHNLVEKTLIIYFRLNNFWINMKAFVILSVLVAGAMCARLDNTYIPPANAQHAGGFNLDTPKLAQASSIQNTFVPNAGRGQSQYQQQYQQQGGLNQGTFTSVHRGNGFQSVSTGSHSSSGNGAHGGFQQQQYQAPQQQQSYGPPAHQQQQSYNNYQQSGSSYQNQASTTPIPILECKKVKVKQRIIFVSGNFRNIGNYS